MTKQLTLLRTGNWVTVHPTTDRVRSLLTRHLTFTEKVFKQGPAKRYARKNKLPLVEEIPTECFTEDHKGRMSFPYGFVPRAAGLLHQKGYALKIRNYTPHPHPEVFEPQWDRVFAGGVQLKYRQDEFLVQIAAHDNGRFDCPTGWGKTFLIGLVARMWPKARLAVVSKFVTVVRDRIYPELCLMLPDVGVVGGGRKTRGRRVTCYTADSLRWLVKDAEEFGNFDVVIVDEVHQAAADNFASMLAQLPGQPRMYGLSATHEMRADGKDYRVEGLFGPVRLKIDYDEARRQGVVVPMEVRVRKVVMDVNPCGDLKDEEKLRKGIWRNSYRNAMVVKDAAGDAAQGLQTMISCAVLEHVLALRQKFDKLKAEGVIDAKLEMVCVYREHRDDADYHNTHKAMKKKGLGDVFLSLPRMTLKRRIRLTRLIERGKVLLFVGTTIFNVGFSPNQLRVVCRADAGSTSISDYQIPGRASRTHASKRVGILRDYEDKFDRGLHQRFLSRLKNYKKLKWKIKRIVKKTSALKQKMLWE